MQAASSDVTYRAILVPLDGSERSEAVLPHATALARQFGARVLLYRAVESPPLMSAGMVGPAPGMLVPAAPPIDVIQLQQEAHAAAHQYLDGHARQLLFQGVETTIHVDDTSTVADQILDVTQQKAIDLIVMTTHGRTGLGRLLFGSVAESVLRRATVPVLVIRTVESE